MSETKLMRINISKIKENPLNSMRSMDEDAIDVLADSIEKIGLCEPLVVYAKENEYILLSGHKRLAAIKKLLAQGKVDSIVLCTVKDAPEDSEDESIQLCQGNIHRSNPEDVENECKIAEKAWVALPATRRTEYSKKFETKFREKNKNNPNFLEDPERFVKVNFSPKNEFIRMSTGLTSSNRTIFNLLKKDLPETAKQSTAKKPVEVTKNKIIKKAGELAGMLEMFDERDDYELIVEQTIEMLNKLITELGEE